MSNKGGKIPAISGLIHFLHKFPCLTFHPKVFKQYGYVRDGKVEGTVGQGVG